MFERGPTGPLRPRQLRARRRARCLPEICERAEGVLQRGQAVGGEVELCELRKEVQTVQSCQLIAVQAQRPQGAGGSKFWEESIQRCKPVSDVGDALLPPSNSELLIGRIVDTVRFIPPLHLDLCKLSACMRLATAEGFDER